MAVQVLCPLYGRCLYGNNLHAQTFDLELNQVCFLVKNPIQLISCILSLVLPITKITMKKRLFLMAIKTFLSHMNYLGKYAVNYLSQTANN